jgi:hypothetical protein
MANGTTQSVPIPISQYDTFIYFRRLIVPGRQMFLPMLLVDFREAFPARMPVRKETLSWVAQVMLLRQIQFGDITGRPLVMIAGVLGYSAMAITQGLNELLPLGLCEQAREGRARTIRFEHVRRDLWREAVPHLRSPVKRRYWARDLRLAHGQSLYAGMTALSEATNISTAPKTVFAIGTREARGVEMDTCPFEEDAAIIVEVWGHTHRNSCPRGLQWTRYRCI